MYAVIMAGGGGTRLWPLSRPETPEAVPAPARRPLAPAADGGSHRRARRARSAAGGRRGRDRAPLRADRPGAAPGRPRHRRAARTQHGRGRRARYLRFERDPERGHARPPGRRAGSSRSARRVYRRCSRRPRRASRDGAFGVEAPLVTIGVQVARPSTEHGYLIPGSRRRRQRSTACRPISSRDSRRSPIASVPASCTPSWGRLERGDLPVAAACDPRRDRSVHRAHDDDRRGRRQRIRADRRL